MTSGPVVMLGRTNGRPFFEYCHEVSSEFYEHRRNKPSHNLRTQAHVCARSSGELHEHERSNCHLRPRPMAGSREVRAARSSGCKCNGRWK